MVSLIVTMQVTLAKVSLTTCVCGYFIFGDVVNLIFDSLALKTCT